MDLKRLAELQASEGFDPIPSVHTKVINIGPGIEAHVPQKSVKPGDWLASLSSAERKEIQIERGLYAYFPDALALVARHSVRSNEKHNPGEPVRWAREKSKDHGDCLARHHLAVATDPSSLDDGQPHIIARAWRALADLQLWAEDRFARGEKI